MNAIVALALAHTARLAIWAAGVLVDSATDYLHAHRRAESTKDNR
ncbi:hypothetical protein [Amycolatopsis thermoflava]